MQSPQNSQPQNHWESIKQRLSIALPAEEYSKWIAPLVDGIVETSKEILVSLPNPVFYEGLTNSILPTIEACKQELGLGGIQLKFVLDDGHVTSMPLDVLQNVDGDETDESQLLSLLESLDNPSETPSPAREKSPAKVADAAPAGSSRVFSRTLTHETLLNHSYTLDSFVKGPSNQFAMASCRTVAEKPGKAYNPLFVFGSTGLGKTHLLHAVGNHILTQNPQAVVIYVPAERFMNEMIHCLRFDKMWDFRQKYRFCDVLLVDDIQFISGRKGTQNEFFHTFNALYSAGKQIVITSDLFPQDIPDIEDRLRNRFQWGLIADIQPPDVEHRIAILEKKAQILGINLGHDVAEYIAKHAKRNVRELEGALHRLNAFAALEGTPITLSLAAKTFKDVLGEPPKRLTIEAVQKIVADHFKIKVPDLKSKRRQRAIALPRQVAMYLSRKLTGASFPEIGERFGGKDHTTVMHNVRKIEEVVVKDLDLKAHVESLERQLEQLH